MSDHWYARWKADQKKPAPPASPLKTPRTMSSSEEIVWLRENVLKKGPKDNPPYADAAKRLAELYAQNYPGMQEDDQ
jgi:hypothetical protein